MSLQSYLIRFQQAMMLNRWPVLTVEELNKLDQQLKLARLGYKK